MATDDALDSEEARAQAARIRELERRMDKVEQRNAEAEAALEAIEIEMGLRQAAVEDDRASG